MKISMIVCRNIVNYTFNRRTEKKVCRINEYFKKQIKKI